MGGGAQRGIRARDEWGTVGTREGWSGFVGSVTSRVLGSHMVKFGFVAALALTEPRECLRGEGERGLRGGRGCDIPLY